MATMTQPAETQTLNALDRCDSCGGQAYVHVELEEGMLLFCAHHFRKHKDALEEIALAIIDEREFMHTKPSMSASAD